MTEAKSPLEGVAYKAASGDDSVHNWARQVKSIGAGVLYGSVALLMGFINKGILQLWPYSNTLLTLQMVASIVIIYSGKWVGLISIQPLNRKSARALLPLVFFYNANVGFALAGLKTLNIPVFNALKRLTPVLIVGAKYLTGDAVPSRHVLFSVLLIVLGCIVASFGDLSFDFVGYSLALTSCFLQTTYLILVEKSGNEKGYNSHEILLYNATLSLPVLSVLIFGSGEASAALSSFFSNMSSSRSFLPLLVFSLFMGSLLNYSLFLCTLLNSALTTTVVGAMKALLSSILGFFVLGGVEITPLVVSGIAMNTMGGIWYAFAKYKQKTKRYTLLPRKTSDLQDLQALQDRQPSLILEVSEGPQGGNRGV